MCIIVSDDETDGTTSGFSLKHTGKQLHLVSLVPLCREAGRPWSASVHLLTDKISIDGNSGRKTINNPTDSRTVTLTECSKTEYVAECIHILMAMSATATLMMMFFTAVAVVTATAAAVITASVASTTAALAAQHAYHTRYLIVGSLTVSYNSTHKMKVLTGTRMVEVNSHGIFLHLD